MPVLLTLQGATNHGVYGILDVIYNPNQKEYMAVTKYGEIKRFSWNGKVLPTPRVPSKSFKRFMYIDHANLYVCWTPNKSSYFFAKEDFSIAIDSVAIAPIQNIIHGGRRNEENFDVFIICGVTLNASFETVSNKF